MNINEADRADAWRNTSGASTNLVYLGETLFSQGNLQLVTSPQLGDDLQIIITSVLQAAKAGKHL